MATTSTTVTTVRRTDDEPRFTHADARVSAERAMRPAYHILMFGYIVLPVVAGVDKFFHFLVDWNKYLAPQVVSRLPIAPRDFMRGVGVVEIVAGLLVALKPSIGGVIVALWLWGIVANLLIAHGWYDVALRDFGLSLGALALSRLATGYGR